MNPKKGKNKEMSTYSQPTLSQEEIAIISNIMDLFHESTDEGEPTVEIHDKMYPKSVGQKGLRRTNTQMYCICIDLPHFIIDSYRNNGRIMVEQLIELSNK